MHYNRFRVSVTAFSIFFMVCVRIRATMLCTSRCYGHIVSSSAIFYVINEPAHEPDKNYPQRLKKVLARFKAHFREIGPFLPPFLACFEK